jgi:gamma-glutamyltranspeptidase/glutathione hydrolase
MGMAGFYKNETAERLVKDVRSNDGIWTIKDLATYKIKERVPDVTTYKNMKLISASLPSSGGLVLSEIFNMLAQFDLESMTKAQRIHTIVETMRRAYRDRAEYMGDPDFVDVPVKQLVSADYIKTLVQGIDKHQATPSSTLKSVTQPSGAGVDTTHFSIIDKQGNKVSATLSINYPFGSCFVAKGTGVLLNDEMDDFAAKPGVPNVYGLVGSHANAIEPGKRMLSSMTPSIVETDDRIAIIGTPGGSRIITMVLLGVLNFYENKSADGIVNAARFHHQYLPDEIMYEPGMLDEKTLGTLRGYGHKMKALDSRYGNMQVIVIDKKTGAVEAASDNRGVGKAIVVN